MKKLKVLIFLFLSINLLAQEKQNVENQLFALQTGILGVWVNYEKKIAENTTIKSEFGYYTSIFGGDNHDKTGFIMKPSLTIEPRFYYNIKNRIEKNRNTKGNSANYLSILASYRMNEFVISNHDINIYNSFSIMPSWGIHRTFGKNFHYELGTAFGYTYYFREKYNLENISNFSILLNLRIGLHFLNK